MEGIKNIMDIKQDFRVYCSTNFNELNKSLIESSFNEEDCLILEGIASTTNIDEDEDYMTEACIEDLKKQAIGLSVLKEHGRSLDDIVGKVIGVPDSDSDKFHIKFKVLPKFKSYLLEFLENEINLGLSIGAKAIDYKSREDSDYGWIVNKVKLYEISLIPLPANWDSFGSVKISKELDDKVIMSKCFNGACKQIIKQYSTLNKELEDAQRDDEETYITKKEVISMLNEEGNALYDRLLSEILNECKKMIEKYHLGFMSESQDDNSSNESEDEEEKNNRNGKNNKIDETEETPDVQKELGELKGTSAGEDINNCGIDLTVSTDDVLKSIEDLKTFMNKSIDDDIDAKVTAKLEKFKKSLREEVEKDLFKELTTERNPIETEQPMVEIDKEEVRDEEVEKAMSTQDIAKMLCS